MAGTTDGTIRLRLFAVHPQRPEENVWIVTRGEGDKKVILGECRIPMQVQQAFKELIEGKSPR